MINTLEMNYPHRRNKLRELMQTKNIPGLLVTNLINIRYLTGFTGSNASLYVDSNDKDNDLFITDGRYKTQVSKQVSDIAVIIENSLFTPMLAHLAGKKINQIGIESGNLTYQQFLQLTQPDSKLEVNSTLDYVESLREFKEPAEMDCLRKAGEISDKALADLLQHNRIIPGKTELEIARELERKMFAHGAEAIAFSTIVASGPNSAIPHHSPTDRILEKGDLVKIDFGAVYAGYHSDITRTFVLDNLSDWQKEIYEVVQSAQQQGLNAVQPGVTLKSVDQVARNIIEEAGYADYFIHGLGHGVGLEIHERPTVSFRGEDPVTIGHVITVEPGIYLPGKGGVRIEDTLSVNSDSIEIFTTSSKKLQVI